MSDEQNESWFGSGGKEEEQSGSSSQSYPVPPKIDRDKLLAAFKKVYGCEKDELDKMYPLDEDLLEQWEVLKASRKSLNDADCPDTEAEPVDDYKPTKHQSKRAAELLELKAKKGKPSPSKPAQAALPAPVKKTKGKCYATAAEMKAALEALGDLSEFEDRKIEPGER